LPNNLAAFSGDLKFSALFLRYYSNLGVGNLPTHCAHLSQHSKTY